MPVTIREIFIAIKFLNRESLPKYFANKLRLRRVPVNSVNSGCCTLLNKRTYKTLKRDTCTRERVDLLI